jgi:hypothetical protein
MTRPLTAAQYLRLRKSQGHKYKKGDYPRYLDEFYGDAKPEPIKEQHPVFKVRKLT